MDPQANLNYIDKLLKDAYSIRISNLQRSINLANEALELSKSIGEKAYIGKSLNQLALYYMIQGEHVNSKEASSQAIEIFKELNDERGLADAKYTVASIYYKTDNYQLGLINLIDCLHIYKKYNDYPNIARTLKSLGTIYEYFGDENNAIKSYEESIEAAINANDRNLESNAYNPLSGIYLDQQNIEKAFEIINKSIVIKRDTGDLRGLAFALYGRGKVFFKMQEYDKAELDYKESIRIHLDMHERLGIGMSYYKLAGLYFATKRIDEALEVLKIAIDLSTEFNIVMIRFKCYYLMYQLYKAEHNIEKALEYLESYLTVKEQVINTQTLKVIENYELINRMELLEIEAKNEIEKNKIIEETKRAEASAKMKQDFLSTMSHEIRTPLNAIITIANLLDEQFNEENNQLISSLRFASNNLMLIINDILDFTKLDSGKVDLDFRPQSIKQLLENIRNIYFNLAQEKQLELTLKLDPKLSEIYSIDEVKIAQILGNLISNAIKYTEKGGVDIIVTLEDIREKQHRLRFKIKDSGIGIPSKYLNEIFESFSQPRSITTRTQGGTGLGLAIVKKLVELFNSQIFVKSIENEGSEFYFDLIMEPDDRIIETNLIVDTHIKDKELLIVDDNVINVLVATKLLVKWGAKIEHAKDGREAVEKTKLKKYDCILMDIHMPYMDGYEASSIIRNTDNPNKNIPIFALTADITAELDEQTSTLFNGFLRKPIEIEKFKETLSKI